MLLKMCTSFRRYGTVAEYVVRTHTGRGKGAGTDASVRVVLSGSLGGSGPPVLLADSRTHLNKFERGNIDEFIIRCRCIGELHAVMRTPASRASAQASLLPSSTPEPNMLLITY